MILRLSRMFKPKRAKMPVNMAMPSTDDKPEATHDDLDLQRQAKLYIEALRHRTYDFVDLGTCDGGGFEIATRQGGRKGLGFDLEPSVVRRSLQKGIDVALYDVCELSGYVDCVDFAVCSHILEHLPSPAHIERVLESLGKLCTDYLLISGPVFEEEDYLESLGIKALHSLMLDHTCKIKVRELQSLLQRIGCRDYLVALTERIEDSSNHWLFDANQDVPPEGLWTYDPAKHLPKPTTGFERPIYRDFVCVVPLKTGVPCDEILSRFVWGFDKIVSRATWLY